MCISILKITIILVIIIRKESCSPLGSSSSPLEPRLGALVLHPIGTPALLPSFWKRRKVAKPTSWLLVTQPTSLRNQHSATADDIVNIASIFQRHHSSPDLLLSYLSLPDVCGRNPLGPWTWWWPSKPPTLSSTPIPPITVIVPSHRKNVSFVRIVAFNNVRNVWGADAGKDRCRTTRCWRS